jgi:hypothetical protein
VPSAPGSNACSATLHRVPSLFRRKSTEVVTEAPVEESPATTARPKGYTPGKGHATPKRPAAQVRKVEPPPANRKEALKRMREKQRAARAEERAGMMAGDEKYLLPRDRGPERALARDVVDSRRTVGTFFFGGALLVLIGSNRGMPKVVQLVANGLWAALALAVAADSYLITRKVKRLVQERLPDSKTGTRGLYLYAIMRGVTFRAMRMPKPRVKIGEKI